jgi:GMP synthase (glutamine-hydrolysing)
MPGVTPEAKILASSKGCPRQIVRYSPIIYGFQCHPEPTKDNIREMIIHCSGDMEPGKFVQSQEELLNSDVTEINNIMINILNNFIHLCLGVRQF